MSKMPHGIIMQNKERILMPFLLNEIKNSLVLGYVIIL